VMTASALLMLAGATLAFNRRSSTAA